MNEIAANERTFPASYIDDVVNRVREMADAGSTPDQIAIFVEVVLGDCRPTAEDVELVRAELAKSKESA